MITSMQLLPPSNPPRGSNPASRLGGVRLGREGRAPGGDAKTAAQRAREGDGRGRDDGARSTRGTATRGTERGGRRGRGGGFGG